MNHVIGHTTFKNLLPPIIKSGGSESELLDDKVSTETKKEMPKSRRQKLVHLTNTNKQGRASKERLVQKIQSACDTYDYCYVFSIENMRNTSLKLVREQWPDSVFVLGKVKILALALGTQASTAYLPNLHTLASLLATPENTCQVGLFFTNQSTQSVIEFFTDFSNLEYARLGNTCTATVTLSQGILPDVQGSMEPMLRKLGMPTSLVKGDVHLASDFTICTENDILDANQAQLLKLFYHQQAVFKLSLLGYYDKSLGQVTNLSSE